MNTLALSVAERKPEIGMLRAVGMQRRQVARHATRTRPLEAIAG